MRVLRHKNALITGAASGIGRAITLALADQGTNVYLLDIDHDGAEQVAEEARRRGVEAIAERCDVSQPDQNSASIRQLLQRWPGIDLLVNNAGVAYYGPTENMTAEQWDWLLKINLLAAIQFTRELLPTLLSRPEGHILNVCSIAGLVAGGRSAAYQVSKFGLVGFTEALRSEYVRRGVGVTALCPGPVITNLYRSAVSGHSYKAVPTPPAWLCATPEQVSRKAIYGIRRNRAMVLVTPMAYALWYFKRFSPGLVDRLNCIGRRKKAPQINTNPVLSPALAGETAPVFVDVRIGDQGTNRVEQLFFESHGTSCEAWLMRPTGKETSPLVLMAHGFAAEKSFRLPEFAARFVDRGLAVMMFDYRNFGGSGGVPRNLVSHRQQLQDWNAALGFAQKLPGVDAARIGLWGTSFSGGHVLICAAKNPQVAAVVSQVPMLDVPRSLRGYTPSYALRALWHGGRDLLRAATWRSPHLVPVVAGQDSFAVMNKPGCEVGYQSLIADPSAWHNRCPARTLLTSLTHRPIKYASRVNCPTLLVVAEEDQLAPARIAHKAAAQMRDAKVLSLPVDHFAPYSGEVFELTVAAEADFLEGCLLKAYMLPMAGNSSAATTDRTQRSQDRQRAA